MLRHFFAPAQTFENLYNSIHNYATDEFENKEATTLSNCKFKLPIIK